MLSVNSLVLNQSQNSFITPQQQEIIKLNTTLRKNKSLTFQFQKSSGNKDVTSLKIDTLTIQGTIASDASGSYTYTFKAIETNDKKKKDFEDNLKGVDIAIKHRPSGKIVSHEKFSVLPSVYGVTATLQLQDEGEYEILIGARAKPKSQSSIPISPNPYWIP